MTINSDFDFDSNFVEIEGSKMHYVDVGQGPTVVFLHGIPTSCYLWRNVINKLKDHYRCIGIDLIGCGLSDKPDIDYTVNDHIHYVKALIEALDLEKFTLVMHGWGSVIGFDYAMNHPEKLAGLCFLEAHIRPIVDWDLLSLPVQEISILIEDEVEGKEKVINSNYFMENLFPLGSLRQLSDTELKHYQQPFQTPDSRRVIWQYIVDLPLGRGETEVTKLIGSYSEKLIQSDIPKLMLYAVPGFITTIETVAWAKKNLLNLTLVDIDEALHYPQESNPDIIAEQFIKWQTKVNQ